MKYEYAKQGYQNINAAENTLEVLFEYKGAYYRRCSILKVAAELLQKSNKTISRYCDNVDKWYLLESVGINPILGRRCYDYHMILTNGDIVNYNTLRIVESRLKRGKVRLIEDGELYSFYPASMVYYKFMKKEGEHFDLYKDVPLFINAKGWNCDISNLAPRVLQEDHSPIPQYPEDQVEE